MKQIGLIDQARGLNLDWQTLFRENRIESFLKVRSVSHPRCVRVAAI